ncbi:MAG: hypothetical protein IBJ11_05955 [Phycisphaerales bacterium]|nr:hypothetical protein [Phycisphaerales bacterium]
MPRLNLSVAFVGLAEPAGLRARIEWAASLGYRAVQLDAAAADARPRDLGRSARRDLASLLRRSELAFAGVDLWIPGEHQTDPSKTDRAAQALEDAAAFAAEMAALAGASRGAGVVSTAFVGGEAGKAFARRVGDAAARHGAVIADHAFPPSESAREPGGPIGVGIDPAAVMLAPGERPADVCAEIARLGGAIAAVRLSDVADLGAARVEPGTGRLKPLEFAVALSVAGYGGFVAVDLRGLARQVQAAGSVLRRFGTEPAGGRPGGA